MGTMIVLRAFASLVLTCALAGPLAVQLERTDGSTVDLTSYRGKPAVLFYEDRASTSLNQSVKDAVWARARRDGLEAAANVIAVANIQAYAWFPARNFAITFIRQMEKRIGIPILLDIHGALTSAPWNLPGDTGSVLLLDANGIIVSQQSGKLTPADTERLLAALETIVATPR
jgi:hypothetical protein